MFRINDIDRNIKKSFWTKSDPLLKIVFISSLSFFLIFLEHLSALIIVNCICLVLLIHVKLEWRQYLNIFYLCIISIYGLCFSQALFYESELKTIFFKFSFFTLFDITFWQEGITYGLVLSLRLIAPLVLSIILFLTEAPHRFIISFERIKIPPNISFLLSTSIRFIPESIENYSQIRQVRKMKNQNWTWQKPIHSFKSEVKIIIPLLIHGIRNAQELALAINNRSLGKFSNTIKQHPKLATIDLFFLIIILLFTCAFLLSKFMFFLYLNDIYYNQNLRFLYDFTRHYL
jgi:energy-coupling factor transport system permease protein